MGVLFAGLAVGAGLAYLLNLLWPVFFNWRPLGEALDLPVIGCVRRFANENSGAGRRWQQLGLGAGIAGLFVMFALILARSDQGAGVFDQLRRSAGLG